MRYLAMNAKGKLFKGPWGDKPPKPQDDEPIEGEGESEALELFEYEDFRDIRRSLLGELGPDEAMFDLLDTKGGVEAGILIRLSDEDFAAFSLKHDLDAGVDLDIAGEVIVSDDKSVAIPIFAIEIDMFEDREFIAPVFMASMAEQEGLGQLELAARAGVLSIGVGSSKVLLEDDIFVDDRRIKKIVRKTIRDGLRLFEKKEWTTDMEEDFSEVFLEEEEEEDE